MSELAEALDTERTTVTRNVALMEKSGLLKLTAGEDRRERMVSLSRKGNSVFTKAKPAWRKVQKQVTDAFGEKDSWRLLRLLDELS